MIGLISLFFALPKRKSRPPEKSAAFEVRKMEPLGRGRYQVTTYSEKYGEVTQTIQTFPKSFFER